MMHHLAVYNPETEEFDVPITDLTTITPTTCSAS